MSVLIEEEHTFKSGAGGRLSFKGLGSQLPSPRKLSLHIALAGAAAAEFGVNGCSTSALRVQGKRVTSRRHHVNSSSP